MAIFHTYIDDSTPGGEDAVAGIGSDTLYGVFASQDFKVSGISTFSGSTEFEKVKHLKDSTGDIGDSGQILASTGSGINWIDANTTNVNSASNIGVNEDGTDAEQWLTFVGAKSGNNPIRADDDLRYNPSTNILTVGNVQLPDLGKLELGGSQELSIFHKDDTNDIRVEVQTGTNYILLGDTIDIKNAAGDKSLITSTGGAGTPEVILSHDGNERLKTTDAGVTVTGTVSATTFSGALTGSASGSSGSCTGNAATATALATAVNIGGVSFDGSADITPGVAAGLSGTPSIEVTNIDIAGTITDKDDITGNAGQVLTSTSTGVAWANAGSLAAGAAAEVAVSDQSGSEADETCFPIFGLDATGSNIALQSNTGLKFNARTGALEATSLVMTGGTSSEFLKADGSVDSTTYLSSIADEAITLAKIEHIDTSSILGRVTASSGDVEVLTKTNVLGILNVADGAEVNVQSDWDQATNTADDFIKNKPTLVTAFTGLSDTPGNYTSQTGKFVAVKSDGTGLEFVNNPDTQRGIDTTPAETATTESISSSWAFAHAAAEGNSGHVPAAGTGNSAKFLANDGTWKTPNYTTNTNTTYGLHCRQDAAGTNNSDDDDPYLWLNPSSGTDDSIQIVGGTNCSVTRDGDGQLTISSSATTLLYYTNKLRLEPVASGVQVLSGDSSPYPGGTVTAAYFSGDGSSLTGLTASQIPTLNQNTTGSSGSCTGNAASATTAASCTGNSATATTAGSCTGNSATATAASKSRIRTDNGAAWHNLVFVDSTDDNLDQVLKMDDESSRLQWNPDTETLAHWAGQSVYLRQWSNASTGSQGQVLTSGGGSSQWAWTDSIDYLDGISITAFSSSYNSGHAGLNSNNNIVFGLKGSGSNGGMKLGFSYGSGNQYIRIRTADDSSNAWGGMTIRTDRGSGSNTVYDSGSGSSFTMSNNSGTVMICSNAGNYGLGGGSGGTEYNGFLYTVDGTSTMCSKSGGARNIAIIRRDSGNAIEFYEAYNSSPIGSIYLNTSSNTTAYNTSSDYRIKENVVNVTGALAKINQLRPVNFNFIGKSVKLDGFIAHEVQAVAPYAVHGEKDAVKTVKDGDETSDGSFEDEQRIAALPTKQVPKYQQLDKSKLIGLLTAAVQELSAKNDALEARIAALES